MHSIFQVGSDNCGLFAIAYATAEAHGRDPADCNFKQAGMRQHLYECFCNGKFTPFPERNIRSQHSGLLSKDNITVRCYRRMPEIAEIPMIECSVCLKWFHVAYCSSSLRDEHLNDPEKAWLCQLCSTK